MTDICSNGCPTEGYNFGGEQSGHFIFLDHNTTGDGLISALQVLSLMKRTEQTSVRTGQSHDGGAASIAQREGDEEAGP